VVLIPHGSFTAYLARRSSLTASWFPCLEPPAASWEADAKNRRSGCGRRVTVARDV
jgi:hypothetical protein